MTLHLTRMCAGLFAVGMACLFSPRAAMAQCQERWLESDTRPGLLGPGYATVNWDPDGAGPLPEVVVIGGSFEMAGTTPARFVAAFDGDFGNAQDFGGFFGTQTAEVSKLYDFAFAVVNFFQPFQRLMQRQQLDGTFIADGHPFIQRHLNGSAAAFGILL